MFYAIIKEINSFSKNLKREMIFLKLGISTASFYPMNTEDALAYIVKSGAPAAEIFLNSFSELEEPFLKKLSAIAKSGGTEIVSVHPFTSGLEACMLFSDYERRTHDSIEFYKKYMYAAAFLGAKYVVLHGQQLLSRMKVYQVIPEEKYFDRYAKMYTAGKEIGAVPAQENVFTHRSADPNFIRNMREHLGKECAFVLDLKQCHISNVKIYDMRNAMQDSLAHVHISDSVEHSPCLLPGKGNFDFCAFSKELEKSGYSGNSVIEVYNNAYENIEDIRKSFQYLRKIY